MYPRPTSTSVCNFCRTCGNIFQNRQRVGDRHLQHIGDRLAFVFHRQGLVVIAVATANLAQHVNVRQKIHLDPPLTFSLAGFAASADTLKENRPGL